MIKSVLLEEQENSEDWDYPCLGVTSSGRVVLFYGECQGIVVSSGSNSGVVIGSYSEVLNMDHYKLYDHTVELSNG